MFADVPGYCKSVLGAYMLCLLMCWDICKSVLGAYMLCLLMCQDIVRVCLVHTCYVC